MWLRDLRQAARRLRAGPGFTAAAVATLGIAVGGTAAMFAITNAVLFRALPVPRADRVVFIGSSRRDAPTRQATLSLEQVEDLARGSRTLAAVAAWRDWGLTLRTGGRTESAYGLIVTPSLFEVLPLQPVLGRLFAATADRSGNNRQILLTDEYWRERFAGDAGVLGRTLTLERGPVADYEVIGVLPPAFTQVPSFHDVKIVALSSIDPDAFSGRAHRNRQLFARLRDGASLADARAEITLLGERLAAAYPATDAGWTFTLVPLIDHEVGPLGGSLRSLFAAVGLVLLIACVNIASLELARALARRREFSIRQALGGTRAGLVRSVVAESLLVALAAGGVGLFAATWLLRVVLAAGPEIPRASGVGFDGTVFGFALAVSVASGLLLGVPATLLATRVDVNRALKEESGQVANAPAARARMIFVAGQVALTLMLLGAAVTAARTMAAQLTRSPGFTPEGLATMFVVPPQRKYPTAEQVAALYARMLEEARAVAGVEAASSASAGPLSGEGEEPVEFVLADSGPDTGRSLTANYFNVADRYFGTLGSPLLEGRDFGATDTRSSPAVAVVNDTFRRRYLGAAALGTRLRLLPRGDIVTIVGVAGDVLRHVETGARAPEIYWPYTQRARWATTLIIRAADPAAAAVVVADRLRRLDGDLQIGAVRLTTDRIARALRPARFMALIFGLFAGVAVLLSLIGVYGLTSYTVAQRRREIGIRVSLGASPIRILGLVSATAFASVVAGGTIGALGLVILARPLASIVPQLGVIQPIVVAAAWSLILAAGGTACYVPARRAAATDPLQAMRT